MAGEKVMRLADKPDDAAPYFAIVLVSGQGTAAMTGGKLFVVGLGPGPAKWLTPEAGAALAQADRLIGYKPYTDRVPERAGLERSRQRQSRRDRPRPPCAGAGARRAARSAVVSGGDAGVFAMAAAVLEAVEAGEPDWRALDIQSCPASAPCWRRRPGSARRSAMISA